MGQYFSVAGVFATDVNPLDVDLQAITIEKGICAVYNTTNRISYYY